MSKGYVDTAPEIKVAVGISLFSPSPLVIRVDLRTHLRLSAAPPSLPAAFTLLSEKERGSN